MIDGSAGVENLTIQFPFTTYPGHFKVRAGREAALRQPRAGRRGAGRAAPTHPRALARPPTLSHTRRPPPCFPTFPTGPRSWGGTAST
jgi:hypothetical protein